MSTALREQASQIEEGAEAKATVQQQRQQVAELTDQLARYKVADAPERSRQQDKRIEELVEALRQARGQSAGDQSAANSEARILELTTVNDQLRVEAERATIEAQEAWRQLEQQEHDSTQGDGEPNETPRLATNVQHLRRRRVRLARLRRALRGRTRSQSEAASEPKTAEQIGQLHEALAASERELIRRWARPSAVATLGWFALLAISLAGASWFVANRFVPATVSASITFQAKNTKRSCPISVRFDRNASIANQASVDS